MSTPASERIGPRLAALASIGLAVVVAMTTLLALAQRAEASGRVYPYASEDWLRYLLPTLWTGHEKPLLLLTGPSTARENLLVEGFAKAFPAYRALQGGLSLGTLDDVVASLAYIERSYGQAALPRVLVLGVSPRFLAEIPAVRPFAQGLELYSPRYRVAGDSAFGSRLVQKSAIDGFLAGTRFSVLKQRPRFQAAFAWLVAQVIDSTRSRSLAEMPLARSAVVRRLVPPRLVEVGIHDYAVELVSPYKYHGSAPMAIDALTGWLDDPESWWQDVYAWDAGRDAPAIRARVRALRDLAERDEIALFVVDLPDRTISRDRYEPGLSARYRATLHDAFAGVPVLDLRCLLNDDEFYDAEHALVSGAQRVTERVIDFVGETLATSVGEFGPAVANRSAGDRSAPCPGGT